MKNRKSLKIGLYTLAICAIAVAVAVLINVLVSFIPSSVMKKDISARGIYELSKKTDSIVAALDEDVTVTTVVEKGKENAVVARMVELYAGLSPRVHVETVDPVLHPVYTAPDGKTIDVSAYEENSMIVSGGKRSRVIEYSEIFGTQYTEEEYDNYYYYGVEPQGSTYFYGEAKLTGAIAFVTGDEVPRVYALTGHGEYDLGSALSGYLDDDNYEVEKLSLLSEGAVPDDASCVFIFYPQSDLSPDETAALEKYIDGGGKILLMTGFLPDGVESLSNLCALGAKAGVGVLDGLVVEGTDSRYMSGYPYYILPVVAEHEITSALPANTGVLMTAAHGLYISDAAGDASVEALLTTGDTAFITDGTSIDAADAKHTGETILGTVSTFEGGGRFVWYSSPSLADDATDVYVSGANSTLMVSTFNYLCGNDDSVSVSAKSMDVDSLTVSSSVATFWTVTLTLVIPLFIAAAGLAYRIYRRRR